jgi:hypothetical protein
MRKLSLVILLLLSVPVFAAIKPMKIATQADLETLTKNLQKEFADNNQLQREALQGALNKIQNNTQEQIALLEKQIKTLSDQTIRAVTSLNQRIALLNASTTPKKGS